MDNKNKNLMKRNRFRKFCVFIVCAFIVASVCYVIHSWYRPTQNNLGAFCTVSLDIICMIFLLIFISNYALGGYVLKRTTRLFVQLLLATLLALFLDFINWAFDGSLEAGSLASWCTVGSLCMGPVMAGFFSIYLYQYMEEVHQINNLKKRAYACLSLNLLASALAFILAITGTAFQFIDGHYQAGMLYEAILVIPFITLIYIVIQTIRYTKQIGLHDVIAVTGYILFMLAGAIIETVYSIGTTYVAVAIADVFIYIMLQNVVISEEKQNTLKWMKQSRIDGLTGLYNRYAYESDIANLEVNGLSDHFTYISFDLNSLKQINDSLGHLAGDEMIQGAASCLAKCFSAYGNVYRTGGDEFAALLFVEKEKIDYLFQDFEQTINNWSGQKVNQLTISYGIATKYDHLQSTLREIAQLADEQMYQNKRLYYKK